MITLTCSVENRSYCQCNNWEEHSAPLEIPVVGFKRIVNALSRPGYIDNHHNTPDKITPAVKTYIEKYRGDYAQIFVVYADCGTGGQLQTLCDEMGVSMIAGPHCYSFFEGNAAFEAREELTCFYLTDFLVRQFDAFVWRPMGLDRHPQLRDMYFGNYTKLVYQAQTNDPALDAKAADCANRLGLAYERRFTGYGDLATTMERIAQ